MTLKSLSAAAAIAVSLTAAPAFAEEIAEVWKAKCRSCHGADGKADTREGKKHKIDDMTTEAWQSKHSDPAIREAIENGVPDTKMKAYKDKLSTAEIDGLVKYVRSFKK